VAGQGLGRVLSLLRVEEWLAVAAAQQEDEAGQVVAQLRGAVGAAAGETLK
jgi:predicted HAD superfamily Cof-like phosphohydrolase